jgi:Calx-beta domain/RTX calcium-binding nonapeptide repeat (4 copies)
VNTRLLGQAARVLVVTACVLVMLGGSAQASRIGTTRADRLVGTPRADRLDGRGGNDVLVGLGGRDQLIGGPGNDRLVGGAGADELDCGPGRDTAVADAADSAIRGCEIVRGIEKPSLAIADASVTEGNSGTTTLSFAVALSAPTPLLVSVRFATSDGTAAAPSDYRSARGVLTLEPGATRTRVVVPIVADTTFEQDETFVVALSAPIDATVEDGSATGTIVNDDQPPARPGLYSGRRGSLGYRDFQSAELWVFEDGASAGRFAFTFVTDCQPAETFQVRVSALAARVAVGPDKKFSLIATGDASLELTGSFDAAGTSASGSFHAHVGFTSEGTHYECDSGQLTWAAKWTFPLPPQITSTVDDAGNLVVSFDDSGNRSYPKVDYKLDATAHATWRCSGGEPVEAWGNPSTTVTGLVPDAKGHVVGTLKIAPPPPQASCPSAAIQQVEYSFVKWTNLTAQATWGITGASRTFP